MPSLRSLAVAIVIVLLLAASVRVVKQYERGAHFRLGRVIGVREPGWTTCWPKRR
jgi:regulator of protease activity HflC (stomatin/prohibitin superfamily)